ncbi:site-specific DNA-methyltransferase [Anaerococcus degeneri]|uniref:Site-specific DNA-methyltransferase n=1 Tax=Anaerococcus degeneri TaxID=361500 RepID=A0ABS7Z1D6_9FIRM|nr:site-specific DNA-methyltransferase [Anaerococcus degeneri]MBP2016499.1 adenine specific DNA methylase Mod [Anaerococcus degeneri]MCA2096477.1 site-specific DNA-methyltransferase [Anaerococcus degeneri]
MTIERFDFESRDIEKSNVEKIGELFPGVITEKMDENGVLKRAIDFDKLMAVLRDDVVEKGKERYEFTWPGKRQAMAEANKSINKTLRPVVEESKDWDNTENLYIEGDNLEVLKLLQESYLGKIKMIYIDPPYNTGNDFVYNDDFKKNLDQYNEDNADYDEEGGKLIKNTESNGRFHSDWCSMIYPRLRLARNLLSDDGVIFISIDDNEQGNLKKICDEVFGEENHIENLIWKRRSTPPNDRVIGKNHEYIYLYSRNNNSYKLNLQRRTAQMNSNYKNPDNDPRGAWNYADLSGNGKGGRLVESCVYPIQDPSTGKKHMPPKNKCWLYNESKMNELLNDNRIVFRGENGTPYQKRFLKDVRDGATLPTLIDDVNVDYSIDISKSGTSQNSAKEIKDLFNEDIFEFPKPVSLIDKLMVAGSNFDSYVLDFFSGFRVIIVIEANSYVNIRSSRLLPKFKTQKINSWCAA